MIKYLCLQKSRCTGLPDKVVVTKITMIGKSGGFECYFFSTTTRQEQLRGARALRVLERRGGRQQGRIHRGEAQPLLQRAPEELRHHKGQLLLGARTRAHCKL